MRARALATVLATVAISGACSSRNDGERVATTPVAATTSATAAAAPAVAGVRIVPAFLKLPKLERPVAMIEVPGQQRMLVVLQEGRILSFAKDPAASETALVLDQSAKTSRTDNEEGLLGLVLDPDFAKNGYLYVYYSAKGGPRRTVLSRLATSGSGATLKADPASELVILEVPQPYGNHKGGQVTFGPDGMLYLGLGDGGSGGDPQGNGQDLTRNLLASIIRIDVRSATKEKPYSIPPNNPFAGASDATKKETWAYGLRNPWRFSFDRETGTLWAGDVGQDEREEIDIIEKGKNYGWNVMEGMACYKPKTGCNRDGLVLPVLDYLHATGGCSVTGGYVYRGKAVAPLRGWYVYGDYCTGTVWAFEAAKAAPGASPPITTVLSKGPNIVSFSEDAGGELYLLCFDGVIYRITS